MRPIHIRSAVYPTHVSWSRVVYLHRTGCTRVSVCLTCEHNVIYKLNINFVANACFAENKRYVSFHFCFAILCRRLHLVWHMRARQSSFERNFIHVFVVCCVSNNKMLHRFRLIWLNYASRDFGIQFAETIFPICGQRTPSIDPIQPEKFQFWYQNKCRKIDRV